MTAATELQGALGATDSPVVDQDWLERGRALLAYIEQEDRKPVVDYETIRAALADRWGLPVVETEYAVGPMSPLGEADREYGRCSIRLLDFLGATRIYVVIRRARRPSPRRMLWALLHELGHFVHHFEMLLSLSTLYQRVALNPRLEADIGEFAQRAAQPVRSRDEAEADLFALDWLLPRWLDDDAELRNRSQIPKALTADGYRFHCLRSVLDDRPLAPPRRENSDLLNRLGAQERERASDEFPQDASRWRRGSWVLFNREQLRTPPTDVVRLRHEYFRAAGYPPRYVPELTRPTASTEPIEVSLTWLERVEPSEISQKVDAARWTPLLAPHSEDGYPAYYIPIRPVPSTKPRDSQLGWKHMMKPTISAPRPLDDWLSRARAQGVGVLLFPRNPAERTLDAEGRLRV